MVTGELLTFIYLTALRGLWDHSSPMRDRTDASAMEARSPNHWAAREFPKGLSELRWRGQRKKQLMGGNCVHIGRRISSLICLELLTLCFIVFFKFFTDNASPYCLHSDKTSHCSPLPHPLVCRSRYKCATVSKFIIFL